MSLSNLGPRLQAGLVLALVFMVGGLAGAVADRSMSLPARTLMRGRPPVEAPGPGGPVHGPEERAARRERGRERFVQQMARDLSLNPGQVTRIDSITRRQNVRMDSLRKVMWPHFDTIIQQTRGEIDHVLTPEQRVKLQEQFKQMEARKQAGTQEHGPMDPSSGKR